MGLSVTPKLWASAAVLAVVLACALPSRALDGVTFTVAGTDSALMRDLRAASGLVGAGKDKAALDLFADHVAKLDLVPRIRFELADSKGDFLLIFVDAKHEGFDFLTKGEDI